MEQLQDYEIWFRKYKGTEMVRVMLEFCAVLLKNGRATAEDTHGVTVTNPSIRGAVARAIRRMGIADKEQITFGSTSQSHGHAMFIWRLKDGVKAQALLNKAAETILETIASKQLQLL